MWRFVWNIRKCARMLKKKSVTLKSRSEPREKYGDHCGTFENAQGCFKTEKSRFQNEICRARRALLNKPYESSQKCLIMEIWFIKDQIFQRQRPCL